MPSSSDTTRITKLQISSAAPGHCACLIQYNGDALGHRYFLYDTEISIGRLSSNSVMLYDDSVSRQHARIISMGDQLAVEDLGSSNGTFINDKPIRNRTVLQNGDVLRIGDILLKYFSSENIESVFHDKIYRMATIDTGTGLFNKQYLFETLESQFRFCRDFARPLSLIYYDLDFFKKINDTYGHRCGDFILRKSAQLAKTCVRKDDVLARFGGEEFVAVMPDSDRRSATEVAERIRRSISEYEFEFERNVVRASVSLGVSAIHEGLKSHVDLLDDADRKLYLSKQAGRNRVTA
jgi:diguanylate cyclase (GGDEF)-like protein